MRQVEVQTGGRRTAPVEFDAAGVHLPNRAGEVDLVQGDVVEGGGGPVGIREITTVDQDTGPADLGVESDALGTPDHHFGGIECAFQDRGGGVEVIDLE